ncbi:probable disease resistance protein At4g27220 isoform X2 [Populus alba]|uniref:probable disease resistance protein At4g27220 isoform X2 n=1 Tax=Populus alba TaxID=43335 RepID=UPI003CC6F02F
MEGFQPSMDDLTEFDLESLFLLYVILKHILSEDDCLQFSYFSLSYILFHGSRPADNQGSILCNDQGGQNNVINDSTTQFPTSFPETMTTMGGLDGTSSSWINQNEPNWPQTPSRHHNSFIHQPQPGHGYMTPNATTSQHGGFNQHGPSFPPPRYQPNPNLRDPQCVNPMLPGPSMPLRSQYFSNQGQVDQAAVIPNIDNVQQENFVPRSQMDNLQVRGLQNQTATPNASNPGPDTSLQSQNRGLNTQQVEMVGSNDPFWNYVEYRADGRMKCKFCPHTYAKDTSISRIKWHLSRERGHNVAICPGVTTEVQEAAFLAMCGGNKRHKSTASSVNVNDLGISTCPQEQNIEIENMEGGIGRVQREVQVVEPGVGEERITSHAIAGNDVVSMTGMRAQEDGVSEGALESRPRTEQVENSRISVQVGAGARSSESLKYNKTRGVPLPTSSTKPVGQAFEEKTKEIWSLLMDDKVPTIGIYGMGGIGKTTILKHIHNELLQKPNICDHVWWVTVSQDFSINRLQNLIAKCLHLDLANEDDDVHRAAKLSEELRTKQKWILILDDLWNNFELDEVGIPVLLKGCKLIMTTRSETVCRRMACHHKIKVKLLSKGEAWTLFMEKLGRDIALLPEVEGIAKDIAGECAGLPLGIIAVAGSLRGVDDPHEWRNTLNKLRESEFRDIDEKVFRLLRFSYDRLGDLALKQCLLYCALFPEDYEIEREELIGYLIDEGILKGMRSRGNAFDEGHTMLNRLEYVCLLESGKIYGDDIRCVKMHDLIRDMGIEILQENSQVMVKAGAQLEELPDAEEWTENLTRVSLMQNNIKEFPSSYSPRCPYLSTLFLHDNIGLRLVADSFFKQLHRLKVLDLSFTSIENLPDSVSDLVSLVALLLKYCQNLSNVPSLKKLRALKRLDLSGTRLEKMPQGMECLTNLRYLRMNGCGEKEFPSGILPKLSHLQVFVLEERLIYGRYAPITVKGKEVGSLRNLETLECHFEGFSDFVEYLRSRDGILSLSTCKILVGEVGRFLEECIEDYPSKTVGLGNLSINGDRDFQVKFLNGIQGLICQCIDARSLCDVLSLENATELEHINIGDCNSMESLVSSSWFCSAPPRLPSCNGTFSGLKEFSCYTCKSMKKLFPLVLLPNLVNLERIRVRFCYKMEEIIGTTDEESSSSNSITEVILPKLITLELLDLPELKSICSAKLICNSLEDITVMGCEKLKRMPICFSLLENGQPSPPPSLKTINAYPKELQQQD